MLNTMGKPNGIDLVVDNREPIGQNTSTGRRDDIRKYLDKYPTLSYSVEKLDASDFKLWDDEGVCHYVTRKSSDYAESLFSGHFSDELKKILADEDFTLSCSSISPRHSRIFFIVEGVWASMGDAIGFYKKQNATIFRTNFQHNARLDTLVHANISVSTAGIEILPTGDLHATACTLAALVDRAKRGWPTSITKRIRRPQPKSSDDTRIQRLMAVWPRLQEKQAIAMLSKWGSVWNVLAAARDGDVETSGVGPTAIRNIQEVLDS